MSNLESSGTLVVIGAQKSGTATLSVDISKCRHFEMDLVRKEESPLLRIGKSVAEDAKIFSSIKPKSRRNVYVDVSTLYTVNGRSVPVQSVVRNVPNIKVVYILREPMARALSHHRQETLTGKETRTAEDALTPNSDYVQNSLYGHHLSRWVKFLPVENIKVLRFEDYIQYRAEVLRDLCRFAGVPDTGCDAIEQEVAHNVTASRPRFHPLVHKALSSDIYHRLVRKKMNAEVRGRFKKLFSLPNKTQSSAVERGLEDRLREIFEQDNRLLRSLISDAPRWGN